MNVAANQQRTFLRLLGELRPHWRRDAALPARIQSLLARHREFGSRDRRLYRELIYTTLRYLPWLEPLLECNAEDAVRQIAWLAAELPATRQFRQTWATGVPPAGDRTDLLPAWFKRHCPEIFTGDELDAQLRRAPLWLRLQTGDPSSVFTEFASRPWTWRPSPVLKDAVQLLTEADVTQTAAFQAGLIEVQDLGSQFILASIGIEPGGHWLDACAGAGGKTLHLARLLGAGGTIAAHDIRPAALDELEVRARRAAHLCRLLDENDAKLAGNPADPARPTIRIVRAALEGTYDGVLVDAPCSGSGTWRRAPHLKWTTTERAITEAAQTQSALLERFSAHVKPGGRLVYATCSLSSAENEDVVRALLAAHPEFEAVPLARTFGAIARNPGWLILPAAHDTDGFFVASLRRRPPTGSQSSPGKPPLR